MVINVEQNLSGSDGNNVVERRGEFILRWGYGSSMDLGNVIATLEQKGIPANEVSDIMVKMADSGVPIEKLANYLADYYKLFGW